MNDPVEFLALDAEIKSVDGKSGGPGEFEVILSTKAVDRDGESIVPGAFEPLPAKLPIFVDHDWRSGAQPVAKAVPFYDGDVLKARGVFASTPRAQEIRTLVREGIIDSMSVGFLNGKRETLEGQKSVISGALFESSFTGIPVNTEAAILVSKAMHDEKAGARNSMSDAAHIQSIHDSAGMLGATCGDYGKAIHLAADAQAVDAEPADVDLEVSTLSLNGSADEAAAQAAAESADEAAQAMARIRLIAARAHS